MPARMVELGLRIALPLITEAVRVVARIHETEDAAQLHKFPSARRTVIAVFQFLQWGPARYTTQDAEQFSGQRRLGLGSSFQHKPPHDVLSASTRRTQEPSQLPVLSIWPPKPRCMQSRNMGKTDTPREQNMLLLQNRPKSCVTHPEAISFPSPNSGLVSAA